MSLFSFVFFNDTATTEIYTLSLHDALPIFVVPSLAYGFGEETGWRGFALPRLQRRRSALSATFLLTVAWAAWHAPFFLYRSSYLAFGPVEYVGFFVGLFAGAIWLTCLYNGSGCSVLLVALWHTHWNLVTLVGAAVSDELVAAMSTT